MSAPPEPFFLPSGDSQIWCVWRCAVESPRRVWIVCPPFAEEDKSARRPLSEGCAHFNARGDATLLLSFRGTGDSGGDFARMSLDDWRDDIRRAVVEAKRRAPNAPISLLGVRLGAALAASISDELGAQNLVLIEPILNGRRYLSEMNARRKLRAAMTQNDGAQNDSDSTQSPINTAQSTADKFCGTLNDNFVLPPDVSDLDGWPLGARLRDDLNALDLVAQTPQFAGEINVHLFQVGPRDSVAPPTQKWADSISAATHAVVLQAFWNLLDYVRADALWNAVSGAIDGDAHAKIKEVERTVVAEIRATDEGESAMVWCNAAGERLPGVWHAARNEAQSTADAPTSSRATIVMLHGWSGYRSGPHQMLTRAARRFAACGFDVARFDVSGRGDAEGDATLATLATMADDARVVMNWCRARSNGPLIVLGLCSGCEVAVGAVEEKVAGMILWSAPVFAAQASASRDARKRADHLKSYARKLLRPQTYLKLLTGRVDAKSIGKVVTKTGGESKNVESDEPGQLPRGWRNDALQRLENYRAPVLLTYGTADPTTNEALEWYRAHLTQVPDAHLIEGANHSYYGLNWEHEVIEITRQWLEQHF